MAQSPLLVQKPTETPRPGPAMPAPVLATIVAIALSGLAPAIIVGVTPEVGGDHNFLGPLMIAAGSGLRLAFIVGSGRRRLFEMVIWLYVYVFLGVAPTIQMRLGEDTDTTPNINHDLDWQTSGIVIVSCGVFLLGVLLTRCKPTARAGIGLPAVSHAKVNVLTLLCIGLFTYYASKIGFGALFRSRSELDLIRSMVWPDKTTNAIIVGATSMGLLVSTIGQIYLRRQTTVDGMPRPWLLPFLSFTALILCVNPVNSARYVFGTVILALLGAWGAYSTTKRFRIVVLSAIFGMVYLFPVADMFRRSLDPSAKSQNPLESMLSGDFDSFAQITNTVDYVASNGIVWGHQLLGVLFFWVPRSVWPDKAFDTGILLGEWKLYYFKNLSAPLWAELYINGGWLLLLIGMFLLGLAVARLDHDSEQVLALTRYPSVLACILPFYLLIVLRGSLLQSVAFMVVILLANAFIRERSTAGELSARGDR